MPDVVPPSRPQASREKVAGWIEEHLALFPEALRDCPVKIVGRRGYYLDTMGDRGRNDRSIFDDAIFVVTAHAFVSFNGNTDPAGFKRGRARLAAPQVIRYAPGRHGGSAPHPAFRQGSGVVVFRDELDAAAGTVSDDYGISLGGGKFTDEAWDGGRFWINLHRGGVTKTSSIGCQTVYGPQWPAFYALVRDQLAAFGVTAFPYLICAEPETA